MKKIGIIGTGNMGSAIARAVFASVPPESIFLANRSVEKAKALAEELKANLSTNQYIFKNCDVIFIGVKPQGMPEILEEAKNTVALRKDSPTVISMAAGIRIETVKEACPNCKIIRIMPNTPVSIGKGVILYSSTDITKEEEKEFCEMISSSGFLLGIDEADMDAGCALSGCGPAFVYMFADALAKGGEKAGLSYENALMLAAKTLIGAAELMLASGKTPEELKKAVCSPGGSTLQGVAVFEKLGLSEMTVEAVLAAYRRSIELGKK